MTILANETGLDYAAWSRSLTGLGKYFADPRGNAPPYDPAAWPLPRQADPQRSHARLPWAFPCTDKCDGP